MFNSVHRDRMLEAVRDLAPAVYLMIHSAYSAPSFLFKGDHTIISAEDVQQGDPLGPLLFCLCIDHHCTNLKSAFCIMYLDDVTIEGDLDVIMHGLNVIKMAEVMDLSLNNEKSEIFARMPQSVVLLYVPCLAPR